MSRRGRDAAMQISAPNRPDFIYTTFFLRYTSLYILLSKLSPSLLVLHSLLFLAPARSPPLGTGKAQRKDWIGSLKFNRFTICLWGPKPSMAEDLRANPTVHEGNVELQFVFFSQERKALSPKGSQARLCSLILQPTFRYPLSHRPYMANLCAHSFVSLNIQRLFPRGYLLRPLPKRSTGGF